MKRSTLQFVEPMECLLVSTLPEGPDWSYEIKLDGYRAQALSEASGVQLLSRNGKDLGRRFPTVVAALSHAGRTFTFVGASAMALFPPAVGRCTRLSLRSKARNALS